MVKWSSVAGKAYNLIRDTNLVDGATLTIFTNVPGTARSTHPTPDSPLFLITNLTNFCPFLSVPPSAVKNGKIGVLSELGGTFSSKNGILVKKHPFGPSKAQKMPFFE